MREKSNYVNYLIYTTYFCMRKWIETLIEGQFGRYVTQQFFVVSHIFPSKENIGVLRTRFVC